jgi:hypothetical protein
MHHPAVVVFLILTASHAFAQESGDGPFLSHFPQSFSQWGKPVNGVSLGVDVRPLPTEAMPDRQFMLGVCIKNDSDTPVYSVSIGAPYNSLKLKVTDRSGNSVLLDGRPRKSYFNLSSIPSGGHLIYYIGISHEELRAIGNNRTTVLAEILQRPAPKDPTTPRLSVESPQFQIYPHGPDQSPLPPDPIMAQLEQKAAQLKDQVTNAGRPNDQSEAAAQLATCYVQMGKISEARGLLPIITDDYDQGSAQMMIVYNDPALAVPQKIEQFYAMELKFPKRKAPIDHMIFTLQFQTQHPEKFLP